MTRLVLSYLSYHLTDKNEIIIIIFNQLVLIYENRLNTESNDTLKLTVSNMITLLFNIRITLFSLQSDKCVQAK
jgi:hypothetical protein